MPRSLLLPLLLTLGTLAASAAPKPHPDTSGWQPLVASDLADANLKPGSWVWDQGMLVARTHDTLWTKRPYGDFILDLEFKVAAESNSGVFLRSGDPTKVLAALEIQVHESADSALYGEVGSIYNAKAPARKMARPTGEWNRFTITCRGSQVSLIFNGEEVYAVDLEDWKEARRNPDGTANKFPVALREFSRRGPIGLQGLHGKAQAPVWYRNLRIRELP
ncbi:MAG: 3-keto-disaccharide hydrolase [Opitutaceae bacterium]